MPLIAEDTLVIEEIDVSDYEKVVIATDEKVGLKGIICVHNTKLGPALGGIRIYPYATFADAMTDVKRLARGMTYKSAIVETGMGGGKSVIIADPKKHKTPELLTSFARAVDSLKGLYICAEDVGCTTEDVMHIQKTTPFVVGLPHKKSSGNPAPFTAWGTYRGIQSVFKKIYNDESVKGRTIAIQGLGSVGAIVAELLFWNGARLIVTDVDKEKALRLAKQFSAEYVAPDIILEVECDLVSPCALGGTINADSIKNLRCKGIGGCANNQLLKDTDADLLYRRGILYAPDFLINAGGLINVVNELAKEGYQPGVSRNKVDQIYEQLMLIYDVADNNKYSTHKAAVEICDYRLKYGLGKKAGSLYFHHSDYEKSI